MIAVFMYLLSGYISNVQQFKNICFALYYDGPDEYTINTLANYINVMIGQGVLHLHSKGNEPKFI